MGWMWTPLLPSRNRAAHFSEAIFCCEKAVETHIMMALLVTDNRLTKLLKKYVYYYRNLLSYLKSVNMRFDPILRQQVN